MYKPDPFTDNDGTKMFTVCYQSGNNNEYFYSNRVKRGSKSCQFDIITSNKNIIKRDFISTTCFTNILLLIGTETDGALFKYIYVIFTAAITRGGSYKFVRHLLRYIDDSDPKVSRNGLQIASSSLLVT